MSQKKNPTYQCIACAVVFQQATPGITCASSHFLCPDCFRVFFTQKMDDLSHSQTDAIPLKCPECKTKYNQQKVFMNLNQQEKLRYLEVLLIRGNIELKKGQKFYHCLFCNDGFIMSQNAQTYYCINKDCQRIHCLICMKQWTYKQQDQQGDQFADRAFVVDDPQWHFFCQQFRKPIYEIQHAYQLGTTSRCPQCKKNGLKDKNCNHMTCGQCNSEWCYMCQKRGGIQHFEGWEQFQQKVPDNCPLFLSQLDDILIEFELEQDKQQVYHSIKVRYYMQQVLKKFPQKHVYELQRRMPFIFNGLKIGAFMKNRIKSYEMQEK